MNTRLKNNVLHIELLKLTEKEPSKFVTILDMAGMFGCLVSGRLVRKAIKSAFIFIDNKDGFDCFGDF